MLRSMTGHGEAKAQGDGFEMDIEVRSVNNRFLRIVTKIADEIAYLQPELEEVIRQRASRGTIFLTVRLASNRMSEFYEVNEELVRKYFTKLQSLAHELHTGEEILLKDLLLLPGSILAKEDVLAEKEVVLKTALRGLGEALDQLNAMRDHEGAIIHREFRERWRLLSDLLEKIKTLAPQAIVEYQQRLEERVGQMLTNHEISLSPEDIIKEVALLAERSDISEEITRMRSHLEQFEQCLNSGGAVGRKLEFILQEMFREANTKASKSIHSGINRILVDFKTELDRLKEQVQNVE